MLRSSLSGCWRDPERLLFEGIEDLLGFNASDAVSLSEVDPILWTKMGGVAKVEPAELNTSWS